MRIIIASVLYVLALCLPASAEGSDYRETQIRCLAMNIYHEARGESVRAQIIVGLITRMRVEDERWPQHYCRVVYSKEFSWTLTKTGEPIDDPVAWAIAHMIARGIFEGRYTLPEAIRCARWYKRSDNRMVSMRGKSFFDRALVPVHAFGAHTAYCERV